MPPLGVLLHSLGADSHSMTVSWRVSDDGGAPIRKLSLNWRPNQGEWQELTLPRHLTQYVLKDLKCGTTYHLYLTPYNKIGGLILLKTF